MLKSKKILDRLWSYWMCATYRILTLGAGSFTRGRTVSSSSVSRQYPSNSLLKSIPPSQHTIADSLFGIDKRSDRHRDPQKNRSIWLNPFLNSKIFAVYLFQWPVPNPDHLKYLQMLFWSQLSWHGFCWHYIWFSIFQLSFPVNSSSSFSLQLQDHYRSRSARCKFCYSSKRYDTTNSYQIDIFNYSYMIVTKSKLCH